MPSYFDSYDDPPGEPRSILPTVPLASVLLEYEEDRLRRQSEQVIADEEAEYRRRDALIASGVVDESGRAKE